MYNIKETDYTYVESEGVDFYGVKLLTGKWRNVLYIYGKVSIKESPKLDLATLGFTYNIQESAEYEADDLINDPEFKDYLGAVLQHIIEDSLSEGEENNLAVIGKIGHNKSNTNARIKSSN